MRTAALALASALIGCAPALTLLPTPSPAPVTTDSQLLAGFGRADITPPPGVGLAGWGPEGARAVGYRDRLYARALVLQDFTGERFAFVALDLGMSSMLLHRRVARDLPCDAHLGTDRIILAATHTHSGPSHFLDAAQHNASASSVSGFDPALVTFLVTRVDSAICEAAGNLHPARIAWGVTAVWGVTRNRAYVPYESDTPRNHYFVAPPDLQGADAAIDPSWTMLRVDIWDSTAHAFRPGGALSIFAVHGTATPFANELLDGDLHAAAERGVEGHIDSLLGVGRGFRPHAVHLLANGNAGDVSPDWPVDSRCPTPNVLGWGAPAPELKASCVAAARIRIGQLGRALTRAANALFDSLGTAMTAASSRARLARAFREIPLGKDAPKIGLCRDPRAGTALVGGAPDGRSRFYRWHILGLDLGMHEGAARKHPKGCQGAKRILFGNAIQGTILGPGGLPDHAAVTVVRVGDEVLAAVPMEVTTVAGVRMRQAMDSVRALDGAPPPRPSALITLADGYLDYVATPEEYQHQYYEGASTLYGPNSAPVFTRILSDLTRALATPDTASPPARVDTVVLHPGHAKAVMPRPHARDAQPFQRVIRRISCLHDTLSADWVDRQPGGWQIADGPVLRIEREQAARADTVAWDDDPDVTVSWISRLHLWEVRWSPATLAGRYRVVLERRRDVAELRSDTVECQ